MTIQMNIGEAKTRLSELVAASERGEQVVLARAGRPVVRLVADPELALSERDKRAAKWRSFYGSLEGQVAADVDWFAPLPEKELALWYGEPDDPA